MNIPARLLPAVDYVRRHIGHEMVSNERFILLLGGAVVVVLLSALIALWNLTGNMSDQLATSKNNLARMQAEVTGDAWPKRLETTQALRAQLAARFWSAETAGLAEASFESWIRGHFTRHGGEPQQIQITRSPVSGRDGGQASPALAGVQRMTAKVLAPFDQAVVTKVLADAAEDPKILIVDRLIVRAGVNSRMEMDISTFIRGVEPPAGNRARP
jgi:hypothetical protein